MMRLVGSQGCSHRNHDLARRHGPAIADRNARGFDRKGSIPKHYGADGSILKD